MRQRGFAISANLVRKIVIESGLTQVPSGVINANVVDITWNLISVLLVPVYPFLWFLFC